MAPQIQTKFYTSRFCQNIHEQFALMREQAPVLKGRFSRFKNAWLITRYEDCLALLRDDRICKDPANIEGRKKKKGLWVPRAFRPLLHNMLNSDEPDHRRMRNLVHKAFTPRMIADLRPRIEQLGQDLAREFHDKLKLGPVDLVANFALPLPVAVIAEMIGIPRDQRDQIHQMTSRIISVPTPVNMLRAVPAINRFNKYIRKLAEQRRRQPENDLLTALVHSEHDGDRFTEDELLGMVFLLTVAGHETTVGLISNAFLALTDFPEQKASLANNEDMMDSAVEEFLRFDGPLSTTEIAFARVDVELHETVIPRGALVLPAILSANRDPRQFDDPDRLDLGRSPNKHLAFGHGIHYCLGAPLARLEARVALQHLVGDLSGLRLAIPRDQIRYKNMFIVHRPVEIPVQLN